MTELDLFYRFATALAARAVTLAAMSNTAVEGGLILASGGPELKRVMLPGFGLILAADGVTICYPAGTTSPAGCRSHRNSGAGSGWRANARAGGVKACRPHPVGNAGSPASPSPC